MIVSFFYCQLQDCIFQSLTSPQILPFSALSSSLLVMLLERRNSTLSSDIFRPILLHFTTEKRRVKCGCYCATSAPPTASSSTDSSPVAAVALVSEVALLALLVLVVLVDNGIPLYHLHNVTRLSPSEAKSSIPASIIPFNGARIPVELVCKIAVTMPLPPPCGAAVGLLNCIVYSA